MAQAALIKFAVGYYYEDPFTLTSKTYGDYKMMTAAEWRDPAFQADLVQAHQEGGGWPLLEKTLECNRALHVAEGNAIVDGALVIEVGHTIPPPRSCEVCTLP